MNNYYVKGGHWCRVMACTAPFCHLFTSEYVSLIFGVKLKRGMYLLVTIFVLQVLQQTMLEGVIYLFLVLVTSSGIRWKSSSLGFGVNHVKFDDVKHLTTYMDCVFFMGWDAKEWSVGLGVVWKCC